MYEAKKASFKDLNIALIQKQEITKIKKNKNGGRKLYHINIVRDFKTVAFTQGGKGRDHNVKMFMW